MKNLYKSIIAVLLAAVMVLPQATMAGNKDRSGQAGASELLINPWARSSGMGGVNIANSFGLESIFTNVAGLAFTKKTELIFSNTQWLKGSEIGINNFGLAQKIGESSVIGVAVMAMSFGNLPVTTTALPEGGIGTFSPSFININIAYAKAFSNAIYGGFNLKIISESISDVGARGVAIDAGIQYVTGEKENIHFGISLKNVGPTMQFSGDGLSIRSFLPGQESKFTLEQRSANFGLPSQLNIGGSYAFFFNEIHTITLSAAFESNAFYKDQYILGAEYKLKEYLMLRGAYTYEQGITTSERTTALTGPSAGVTVQVPINKEKNSLFSVDYSFRATNPFKGIHTMAVRMSF
jgi:hypothetical protein